MLLRSFHLYPLAVLLCASATAIAAPPSVIGCAPCQVNAGGPGHTMTVLGNGFVPGSAIEWAGSPLTTTFLAATQLSAQVPASLLPLSGKFAITVRNPDGAVAASTTYAYVQPVLTAISPTAASAGMSGLTITATGIGFSNHSTLVFINHSGAMWNIDMTFTNSGKVSALIPMDSLVPAGGANINIADFTTGTFSNVLPFVITAGGPKISAIAPNAATVGGPAFTLAVTGTGFTSDALVYFSSIPLTTTFVSSTRLDAAVPASYLNFASVVPITVVTASGGSAAVSLTVTDPPPPTPAVAGVSPASVDAGTSGFALSVTGSGFVQGSKVLWSGSPLTTTFQSAGALTAQVPPQLAALSGRFNISVSNPAGTTSNSTAPVSVLPVLSSASPSSAAWNGAAFTLTATGAGLSSGLQLQIATPDSKTISVSTVASSSTSLTAQVPAAALAAPGTAYLTLINTGSNLQSRALAFPIVASGPSITFFSPSSAVAGGPAFTLSVTGSNFSTGSVLYWNSTPLSTAVQGLTQLTAQVPAQLIAGSGVVSLSVVAGGSTSNTASFTINGPLTISSASPAQVYAEAAEFRLTVNGTGFVPGATVQWAGTSLATTFVSSTQLTAIVPLQLQTVPGNYDLTVANPGGLLFARWSSISVYPSLQSIDPAAARIPIAGVGIVAYGGGFNNTSVIVFDSSSGRLNLPTTYYSTSKIAALIPGSALTRSETARVYVLDARTGYTSTAQSFTAQQVAPVITTLAPVSVSAGSPSFQLTVALDYMGANPVVKWNGTPLGLVEKYATAVTVLVPSSLVASPGTAQITVESDGLVSAGAAFTIGQGPTVLTASPTPIDAGGPTITIDVVGSGFVSGSKVYWVGQPLATVFRSATALSAVLPSNLTALTTAADITVGNPDGTMSGLPTPAISVQPVFSSLSPGSALPGSADIQLVVKGIGFRPTSRVDFFSRYAAHPLSTTYVDSTTLSALLPAELLSAAVSATVYVSDSFSRGVSRSLPFTVGAPSPVLSTLKPSSARAGDPGFELKVEGYELRPGTRVRWNGVPLTMLQAGPEWIASVPSSLIASQGSAAITLINDDGLVSNSMDFPITGSGTVVPAITSLSPNPISVGGAAAKLLVSGSGFVTGSVVYWNGTPLSTVFLSSAQLEATVPGSLLGSPASISITVANPGGTTSAATTLVLQAAAPVISSIAPSLFPAGSSSTTMIINGSGFVPGASVYWGAISLAVTGNAPAQLTVTVPSNLLATPGAVLIKVVCGTQASNLYAAVVYSVFSAPQLTSASPAQVDAGAPGFTLTATGANFQSGAKVHWAGTPLATTFVSSTQLTAVVPANLVATSGRSVVTVMNPDGEASLPFTQMYVQPVLSTVAPLSLPAGAGATLSITGRGFRPTAVVQLTASGREWPLQTSYLSATALSAEVRPEQIKDAGTAYVTITDSTDATFSRKLALTVTSTGPSVTTLLPNTATAGEPDFQLTVNGQNFDSGAVVRWETTSLPTVFVSARQLTASVASSLLASPGTVSVGVVNQSGAKSPSIVFQIVPRSPSILSLSPNSAEAGGPEFVLSVHGADFSQGAIMSWGDAPLATSFVNPSELAVTVPAGRVATPGMPFLVVANRNAQSAPISFPIKAAGPVIARLDPAETTAGGASFRLTVTGKGFQPDDAVRWNGTALPSEAVSSTQMTAMVPVESITSAGSSTVTIARATGEESLAVSFLVNPADPFIREVSPNSATQGAGATSLAIKGKGFLPGAVVAWNGQPLETEFVESGWVTAHVPAELVTSAGEASLAITNPAGTPGAPAAFLIHPPVPELLRLSPSSATSGGADLALVVHGAGFLKGSAIHWEGVTLETTFLDSTRLKAVVPASWILGGGMAGVAVSNPDGLTTDPSSFPVLEAKPTISAVSPGTLGAGVSGLVVTVDGSGYLPGTILTWEGAPLETSFIDPTRLTAQVPADLMANSGSARVTAVNPQGQTSAPWLLRILGLSVVGFDQQHLVAGGPDTMLKVFGNGFQPGATVYWNGSPLGTTFANNALTASVPARLIATEGIASIAVAIPGGLMSSAQTLSISAPDPVGHE
ncbi:beta strand repeat-containing protein [Paludibaculum fermentans]|uniref:IPT/TIG domain-containing protein n=1 Tax=Paludibaculum fermentans TaxID=1473598 RepID=A0A7S7SIE1_PALFE|nr:IPT/TIG domain-containing protein [Paludibaculum fermentans]QOY86917.1 IPT/TIG domain-containing protein [Paludibaculum fermentans]